MSIAQKMVEAFGHHPTGVQLDAIKSHGQYVRDSRANGGVAYEFPDRSWVRVTWTPVRSHMTAH